jgi:hypothetical protein
MEFLILNVLSMNELGEETQDSKPVPFVDKRLPALPSLVGNDKFFAKLSVMCDAGDIGDNEIDIILLVSAELKI